MAEFNEKPMDFVKEIKYDAEFMSAEELKGFVLSHPNLSSETVARYMVDFHYRRAMPWACSRRSGCVRPDVAPLCAGVFAERPRRATRSSWSTGCRRCAKEPASPG